MYDLDEIYQYLDMDENLNSEESDSVCLEVSEDTDVQVYYNYIVTESEKSYLFNILGIDMWHPKSLVNNLDTEEKTFFIPEWLFVKKQQEYNNKLKKHFTDDIKSLLHDYNAEIVDVCGTPVFRLINTDIPFDEL